jgi:hypothetical protein
VDLYARARAYWVSERSRFEVHTCGILRSEYFHYNLTTFREKLLIEDIGIEPQGSTLSSLSDFTLPPRHTLLFEGNFLVLDHHIINAKAESINSSPSFLEVGFGDNRKEFAGLHRFEVSRDEDLVVDGGATVCFSSLSCNPTVNKVPFSKWGFEFHKFYAQCLFRDGIREVLRK